MPHQYFPLQLNHILINKKISIKACINFLRLLLWLNTAHHTGYLHIRQTRYNVCFSLRFSNHDCTLHKNMKINMLFITLVHILEHHT